jgi:hypothetical protein
MSKSVFSKKKSKYHICLIMLLWKYVPAGRNTWEAHSLTPAIDFLLSRVNIRFQWEYSACISCFRSRIFTLLEERTFRKTSTCFKLWFSYEAFSFLKGELIIFFKFSFLIHIVCHQSSHFFIGSFVEPTYFTKENRECKSDYLVLSLSW